MAGVRDDDLTPLGPWPAGVNNTAKEHQLPTDENGRTIALRAAVNVDFDNLGWPATRAGWVKRVDAGRVQSMFGEEEGGTQLFAVVDGDLKVFNIDDFSVAAEVRAGIGDRYASFAKVVDDVYWTNGVDIGRISPDLADHPVWIPNPVPPAGVAVASGGLAAGTYFVCVTWIADDGRESGASPDVVVDVLANGGIALTFAGTPPADAARLRVYCSTPDDDTDTSYFVADLPPSQPMFIIGAHTPGRSCETKNLIPLPPGQIIRFWNGGVLVATANLMCWSTTLRFGLMHQDSALRFGERITLLEPVGEGGDGPGVYVADHKRTYWMSGAAAPWNRVIRYGHPALLGTGITVPGNVIGLETTAPVAIWMAGNGVWCRGMPGGQVIPLREGELALPEGEHGSTMFREFNGIRQIMTTFIAGGANVLGASDSAVATIRRNGVEID